jgi:hypothetical protein
VKGIARTVWLLLWGRGLQSWLTVIGAVLTLAGIAPHAAHWRTSAQPLFLFLGFMGVALIAISPIFSDAIVFRYICAARSNWLVPHGRLKLALGAFASQLLLALFISLAAGALMSPIPAQAAGSAMSQMIVRVFVIAFGCLTLHFLCYYWAAQFRVGVLIFCAYALLPALPALLPRGHLGAWLVSPSGLGTVAAACLLAWAIFVIRQLAARHIRLPVWLTAGAGSSPTPAPVTADLRRAIPHYGAPQAMRILLGGSSNPRRVAIVAVSGLGIMLASIILFIVLGKPPDNVTLWWGFVICFLGGIIPTSVTGVMSRRARFLWLKPGLERGELFTLVEMRSWRILLVVALGAFLLAVPLLSVGLHFQHLAMALLAMLAVPVAAGAILIYVWLLHVRGGRVIDLLIVAAATVMVVAELVIGTARFVTGPATSALVFLPAVVAVQIILVPVLRYIARRRWQRIDWLVHKPLQPLSRLN